MKLDNSQWTVAALRGAGYKVRVTHFRMVAHKRVSRNSIGYDVELLALYDIKRLGYQNHIMAKGGLVEVSVLGLDGYEVTSRAECSVKDWYNNKVGVKIALNRAMEAYNKALDEAAAFKALEKTAGDGTGT